MDFSTHVGGLPDNEAEDIIEDLAAAGIKYEGLANCSGSRCTTWYFDTQNDALRYLAEAAFVLSTYSISLHTLEIETEVQ